MHVGKSEHTFSTNDAICTPAHIYEPIIEALGPIGLDPFGNPASKVPATERILLRQYKPEAVAPEVWQPTGAGLRVRIEASCFDPHGAGVVYGSAYDFDWCGHGLVFCNGPYSDVAPWAHQMWSERGGDEVVGLVPVRTGARWWQQWTAHSDAILFLRGRVHFDNYPHQAPFHSALSYVGPRGDLFVERLKHLGWCVRNRREWCDDDV